LEPEDEFTLMLSEFDEEFQSFFGKGEVIPAPQQAIQLDVIARRFYVRSVFALAEAVGSGNCGQLFPEILIRSAC
jgi:hypothetical protein